MKLKSVWLSCVTCGKMFQHVGVSFVTSRTQCYKCKPQRIFKTTTRRGCPRCGSVFIIDPNNPNLKQCPQCRKELKLLKNVKS